MCIDAASGGLEANGGNEFAADPRHVVAAQFFKPDDDVFQTALLGTGPDNLFSPLIKRCVAHQCIADWSNTVPGARDVDAL